MKATSPFKNYVSITVTALAFTLCTPVLAQQQAEKKDTTKLPFAIANEKKLSDEDHRATARTYLLSLQGC